MQHSVIRPREPSQVISVDRRIPRTLRGDRASADSLVRELLPRARNLVRFLCGNDEHVDELTQLGLVSVLLCLRECEDHDSFHGWADQVVARQVVRWLRAGDSLGAMLASGSTTLHSFVDRSREEYSSRRALAEALDALAPEQRWMVVLLRFAGFTIEQAAVELRLSPESAADVPRGALAALREARARTKGGAR